jgi:predicted amidophosphoribosyltransferase
MLKQQCKVPWAKHSPEAHAFVAYVYRQFLNSTIREYKLRAECERQLKMIVLAKWV